MTTRRLPLAAAAASTGIDLGPAVGRDESCITCGDVAVALTVVSVQGPDARCRDDRSGAEEVVAVDLVAPLAPGDRVLVHARVALEVLPKESP